MTSTSEAYANGYEDGKQVGLEEYAKNYSFRHSALDLAIKATAATSPRNQTSIAALFDVADQIEQRLRGESGSRSTRKPSRRN